MRVFYDGDCPFCTAYVRMQRLKEAVGHVELINLRRTPEALAELAAAGLDPDEGMVVDTGGRRYHGADAMAVLGAHSTGSGLLNRLTAGIFANRLLARLAYPLLRAGRNATLMVLGRQPIGARDPAEAAHFEIFARFFGLFAVLHTLNYMFEYTARNVNPTTPLVSLLGLALLLRPTSRSAFVGLVLVMAVDAWVQAPIFSNHTMMKNFFLLAVLGAGLWHWLRGASWDRFQADVRPVGRVLLLVMYFYGIFHKINTGFLDPEVSCAVQLWQRMPPPMAWMDHPVILYATIYGTYVIEGLVILMLLVPRWRNIGIVVGVGFHALLATSSYALYPSFSTLAIVMHMLFLSPATALGIVKSASYGRMRAMLVHPLALVPLLAGLAALAMFARAGDYGAAGLVWLAMVLWPLSIILREAAIRPEPAGQPLGLWSRALALNLVGIAFFFNGAMPYLGLKTAQTINMFANIHLEGGVSNHLVLPWAPGPFAYLEDIVLIHEAVGAPELHYWSNADYVGLVYYSFLDHLSRRPEARVSYRRGGQDHVDVPASEILARDGHMLHPAWVRKWFHFRPVDLRHPRPCD